ncbi:MAG: hypothetical protein MJA32_07140 [Proteobacteria bacterium]|nr:hypothetical protein [Pseudomonadota bacterium]
MKLTRKVLVLFIAVSVLPTAAVGQDEDVSIGVIPDGELIDNAVVPGRKSPDELRRDFWRAEKDFYSIYNELNDVRLYDVRCTKEAPTGTRIKTQMCRPKFVDKALREGRIRGSENLSTDSRIADKMAAYQKNVETLVAANPELQTAAAALNLAHARLTADEERIAGN